MKTKKMFLLFAVFIFAAVAGYNIHMVQTQNLGDISLADIAVMAQADGESGGGGYYSCMKSGGWMRAGAYRCDDPGYPSLPQYECGTPFMARTGKELVQCFK